MKKYLRKENILIGILFVLIGILSLTLHTEKTKIVTPVSMKYADPVKDKCKGTKGTYNDTSGETVDKYDIQFEINSSNKLKVSVNPEDKNSKVLAQLRKAKFKLVSINGKKPGSTLTVYYKHSITIDVGSSSFEKKYKISNDNDAYLKFKADDIIISDPAGDGDNCISDVTFTVIVDNAFSKAIRGSGDGDMVQITKVSANSSSINCSHPQTEFQTEYCKLIDDIKKRRVTNHGDYSGKINKNDNYTGGALTFHCKTDDVSTKKPGESGYFSNVHTMTATKTSQKELGMAYQYRFAPGNYYYDTAPLKCSITCTETVKVEYGPPVATKAGLCFEYEVQATSYVICKADKFPDTPKQFKGYCNPMPRCVHKNYTITRAGPDEEFDDCVEECDGGKYSEVCSQKCYDKVYARTNRDMLNYSDYNYAKQIVSKAIKNQVDECLAVTSEKKYRYKLNRYQGKPPKDGNGYYGCFYWTSSSHKKIQWWGDKGGDAYDDTPTRYYFDEDPGRDYSYYVVVGGGFVRRKHADGDYCHAKCHYSTSTCNQYTNTASRSKMLSKNEYLNPGVAHADNVANKKTYEAAVAACKARAACTETKATFTIGVNNGDTTVLDVLDYKNGVLNGNKSYSEKIKVSKYIKSFAGCYKNPGVQELKYQTRWGFRGACINKKTGSMVNSLNSCGSGSAKYPNKYCLPLDAKNVNVKWWNYYYTKRLANYAATPTTTTISAYSKSFIDECNSGASVTSTKRTTTCNWQVNNIGSSYEPNYNITASARDFGYYKWDFDIKCFYATNSRICNTSETNANTNVNTSDNWCISEGMLIRTVDLKNLFPNVEGDKLTSPDTTGRNPGYNWTSFATNNKKNAKYISEPSKYLQWVQKKNYGIYSEDYLDYEVRLTKEKIRSIKNTVSATGFKYNEFKSGSADLDSTINYKSGLLRTTLKGYVTLPTEAGLKCNNMKNHNHSGPCLSTYN